jgi:hypothetical protein
MQSFFSGACVFVLTMFACAGEVTESPELERIRREGFRCRLSTPEAPITFEVPKGQSGETLEAFSRGENGQTSRLECAPGGPKDRVLLLCNDPRSDGQVAQLEVALVNGSVTGTFVFQHPGYDGRFPCPSVD